jgi:FMN phosphatase YigB (HAD superfamily)
LPTLLLDLDGTLIAERPHDPAHPLGHVLLGRMRDAARAAGLPDDDIAARIAAVDATVWWCWADYLAALHLDAPAFWARADAALRVEFPPMDPELPARLTRLHDAGYRLVIASNNPTDGIAHKLRLVGLDASDQRRLFAPHAGTEALRATKHRPAYWAAILRHHDLHPADCTVVGNHPDEDDTIPRAQGIARAVLVTPTHRWPRIEADLLARVAHAAPRASTAAEAAIR